MPKRVSLRFAGLLLIVACGPPWGPPPEPAELIEADREFYEATREQGAEGWAAWFAAQGRMYRQSGYTGPGYVEGRDQIRAAMEDAFADSGTELRWAADTAVVAASGDLGYTLGRWELVVATEAGDSVAGHGHYVTIWGRQSDGSWKVLTDIGSQAGRSP